MDDNEFPHFFERGVVKLGKQCLETIADNIALQCLGGGVVYPDAVFSRLINDYAIQNILDIAVFKKILSPMYFSLLIHKNVKILNLGKYKYTFLITDEVLLQLRCKGLLSLNLSGLLVSSSCLNKIIPNHLCLTRINMSQCRGCTDAVLQNIARYCSNLKELNLESCGEITDNGIAALLKPHDNSEQAMVATRLAYLNVSSTLVTMKSLVALLNGLPMLLSLSFSGLHANPCTKFTKLNSDQLRLQYLDLVGTFSRFTTLKEVMKSCPDLIELKLSIPANAYENTHELFAGLRKCSKLKSVTVSVVYFLKSELPRQRFELGKSFFGHIGQQLESLNLAGPMNLCLVALCHHCNALKQLVLHDCQLIQPFLPNMKILPKEPNSLCNISTLSVFCSALQAINLEQVQFNGISLSQKQELLDHLLTSHPNLHELSLKSVPIEEDILMKILLSSSGSKLRKLVLSCYDNITSRTVVWIEENCRRLEYLELLHSWVLTWSDICQINDRARRNGRNLEVVVPDEYDLIGY